ncbi:MULTISPECIES: ComEC/Rec2 family competence protein [Actinoalloteichus]|uniref:ComEC/Rec2-related protein n=1 Tax=Actinoalloteichus fjordicus TaxID=1612552 RepID=A0AAC9L9T1_9PSEU|nr:MULTISPECIES: ComEC/Rec2 family competence protein [Actinoalloteichus]APU13722.1 ComEC/Rec2-related protein [Actinoalloteichus fjordicus]APU19668.1 ComEC/Rec2-related protein [Actinoalloteichus sp. GBA129-24]
MMRPTARRDLRLVPSALSVWAVTLVGIHAGHLAAACFGALACLVMLGCGLCARHGVRVARRMTAGVLAAGLLTAAAAVGVGVRERHASAHPLREAAERGDEARVRMQLTDDPARLMTAGYAGDPGDGRLLVRARLAAMELDGQRRDTRGRLIVLADDPGWSALLPGQQVTAEGALLPPRPGDLTVAVLRVRGPPLDIGPVSWWQSAADTVRGGLRTAAEVLHPDPAGLLPALVVGDTGGQSPQVEEEFQAAGLTHLTAVSGANLAILCGAVLLLCRAVSLGPVPSTVAAAVALVGFVILARPEPSVLRAAAMGSVTLLALVLGRRRCALPALAGTVIALLLVLPELSTHPGFALSVAATAGLVLLAPGWAGALRDRGVPIGVAEALAVAVAAQVATAPLIAGLSGEVSLISILANLLAAPVVAPATLLGVLAALVSPFHLGTAELLVYLAGPEVWWLILVGRHAAAVPAARIDWPSGVTGGVLLTVLALILVLIVRFRRVRVLLVAMLLVTVLFLLPARLVSPGWPPKDWAVVACDVAQGDAVVLATGEPGRVVLVDVGPDTGAVHACLRDLGVRSIALIVLSHLHADHVGGLTSALTGREVGAIALGPVRVPDWAHTRVRESAAAADVPVVELQAGRRLAWSDLLLEVLGPVDPSSRVDAESGTEVNDNSLVLRATTPAGRVLLTGDIELAGQSELLRSGADVGAEILKVPHHGSRYTSPRFLAAVRPRTALISVGGDNRYGHPSATVVEELSALGAVVLRTDRGGDVAVVVRDGDQAVVRRAVESTP